MLKTVFVKVANICQSGPVESLLNFSTDTEHSTQVCTLLLGNGLAAFGEVADVD